MLVQLVKDDSTTEGGVLSHKVKLVDADGQPVVVPEGGKVTVEVSYIGEAENGVDFEKTKPIVIEAGQSEATFTNQTIDDTLIEGTEQYTVSIDKVENVKAFETISIDTKHNSATGEITDNDSVEWKDLEAVVSEEGLSDGVKDIDSKPATDTNDISDTKDVTFKFGDMNEVDSGLDHKGTDVKWFKEGDTELIGKAGDVEVIKASMDAKNGEVTTTLLESVDHKGVNTEDTETIDVKVEAIQGENVVGNTNMSITIEDDSPVQINAITEIETDHQAPTLNIIMQFDKSWSMAFDKDGDAPIVDDDHYNWVKNPKFDGVSKVEIARQAIMDMIEKYEEAGSNVRVQLIAFNSGAEAIKGGAWLTKSELSYEISMIDQQLTGSDNGGTNYKTALEVAKETYESSTPPQADKTISYFISDGDNYRAEWKVEAENQADWNEFLTNNGIEKAYAIGFADAKVTDEGLGAIAHKTEAQVVETDKIQEKLVETVEGPNANVAKEIQGSMGENIYGADGEGEVSEVIYNGNSYHANEDGEIIIQTDKGGELIMNAKDGSYTYNTINKNIVSHRGEQEQFEVVVKDADGDSVTNTLRVDINANKEIPVIIDKDSVEGEGYTVEAFKGDEKATISDTIRGFGVESGAQGVVGGKMTTSDEIGTAADGAKTSIVVTFDQNVNSADVKLGWLASKVTAAKGEPEVAKIDLLDEDGNVLKTYTINGGSDGVDDLGKLALDNGGEFHAMKFYTGGTKYSDYVINEIRANYTEDDRPIRGTDADEYIDGQEDNDVIQAGGGNDTIVHDGNDSLIDGGAGHDTLNVGEGEIIDFSNLDNVKNMEQFDFTNNASETLNISVSDVVSLGENNNTLKITGDDTDKVSLKQSEFEKGDTVDGFTQYKGIDSAGEQVVIEIKENVHVDLQ